MLVADDKVVAGLSWVRGLAVGAMNDFQDKYNNHSPSFMLSYLLFFFSNFWTGLFKKKIEIKTKRICFEVVPRFFFLQNLVKLSVFSRMIRKGWKLLVRFSLAPSDLLIFSDSYKQVSLFSIAQQVVESLQINMLIIWRTILLIGTLKKHPQRTSQGTVVPVK